MDLAPTIAAATGNSPEGNNGDTYGLNLVKTEMPKSAASEDIKAIGTAAKEIGNTPTAVAGAVGASVGAALRETGGGGQKNIIGGDGQVTQSTTKTTIVSADNDVAANGEGSSAGGGALPTDPAVPVDPAPIVDDPGSTEPVIVSED